MQKTIFITGGAGFIGSTLVDALIAQNNKVVCFDNFDGFYPRAIKEKNIESALKSSLFTLTEGDIRDKPAIEGAFSNHTIDTVVHLAAKVGVRPSIQNPQEYIDINVSGTLNILEAMRVNGVKKLVVSSSSSIYGNNKHVPYAETDQVDHPISPYAASKKSAELLAYTYHHLYQLNIINLRLFTVFGPRQRPDLAIHKFFESIYSNKPIDVYGDGGTSRDYTYVGDIVAGFMQAIRYLESHSDVYEIINLGNSSPLKLSDLIAQIEDITQKKFAINKLHAQMGDVNTTFADISKARTLLDYNPETTISEGLLNFKSWFESAGR